MAELIVALDVQTREEAVERVKTIGDAVGFYKIGLELFSAEGPDVVKAVKDLGKKVFLDLKFHDIPRTVERAVGSCLRYGADLHDIYGRLIEKMAGKKGRLRFGGDAAPKATKGLPKKVRLVDIFSGPVALDDKGELRLLSVGEGVEDGAIVG